MLISAQLMCGIRSNLTRRFAIIHRFSFSFFPIQLTVTVIAKCSPACRNLVRKLQNDNHNPLATESKRWTSMQCLRIVLQITQRKYWTTKKKLEKIFFRITRFHQEPDEIFSLNRLRAWNECVAVASGHRICRRRSVCAYAMVGEIGRWCSSW